MALNRRIVVLGDADDHFTRAIADRIAALPGAECVYGSPSMDTDEPERAPPASALPYFTMAFDPDDAGSIQRLIGVAFAVVNLYDVYPGTDRLIVPAQCAALGVHYVDVANTREYVSAFTRLAREAAANNALLVTRAGAVPAIAAMLADLLAVEFDRISEIHVALTPGIDDRGETATVRESVARLFRLTRTKRGGRWREQHWWDGADTVPFAAPIGARRGYPCDLPCLDDLLKQYDARTAAAHTVFERGLLSLCLGSLAPLLRRGWLKPDSPLLRPLHFAANRERATNSPAGIRVEMRGTRGRMEDRYVASLLARHHSARAVSLAPVVALIRRWLTHGVREAGAMPCIGLLKLNDLNAELYGHDVVLVRE